MEGVDQNCGKKAKDNGSTCATDDETDLDDVDNINERLPAEIVSMILAYLDADYEAVIAERVCRMWASLSAPIRQARQRREIWRRRWLTMSTPQGRRQAAEWHQKWFMAEAARRGH
ncbi:ankyrin repeat protein [Pandoravirus inopinatum]|uniref:Ankyrin repeat protein n=1 Tax=Pandoravirus inopinatum TaxID=1605721 RepID=A0A0B5J6K4_9VIRU|nr:ankyrin repeat protein [Pandoravirus inopinatum]AJF97395.1 ankyrin repeat protein [Pandoravirus inopinatum]